MRSGQLGESSKLRGGEVHPELEALLALQEKDQAVTATDEALAALHPELQALDEAQAVAERALATAQAAIQAASDRREELEGKIANYRTMQEQRRQRLEWVRGAKEASTLMAELDLARSVLAKEEAEVMRSGGPVTESERRAAEAALALEGLRGRQAAARARRKPPPGLRPRSPASSTSPSRSRRSWCSGASALPISPRRSSVPISSASPIRSLGPTWRAPWRWWRAWSVPGRRSWCTATTTWTASAPRRCSPACCAAWAAASTGSCRLRSATAPASGPPRSPRHSASAPA